MHAHALELGDLFVDPDRSGRGIGRQLVDDAVSIALHRGLRRVDVLANRAAVAFYRAVGFSLDGEIDTEFGSASRLHLSLDRREQAR